MVNIPYVRRQEVIKILSENKVEDITSLSKILGVSEMTIRRDLDKLEKGGDVIRIYGGAKIRTKNVYEPSIGERLMQNIREKKAIGMKAAEFIEDGDVVAFDASTTALEVANNIKNHKELTVITNNIALAIELSENKDITIILLGGIVRKSSLSLVGSWLPKMLKHINIDKFFISSSALSFKEGLTDATIEEVEAKKAIIDRSATKEQKQCLKKFEEKNVGVIIAK
jgi:DeoR family fructose operon transcriptional repressor